MDKRGVFILFEGVASQGKTTQAVLLTEWMKKEDYQVEYLCFPDTSTTIGRSIDFFLKSKPKINDHASIHLMCSVNRWESATKITSFLENGVHVIVDRYSFSGIAHSMAKGLDLKLCKNTENGLPAPDVVIYMDMPIKNPETAEYEEQVRKEFMKLRQPDWQVIDGNLTEKSIHFEIQNIAMRTIFIHEETKVQRLNL